MKNERPDAVKNIADVLVIIVLAVVTASFINAFAFKSVRVVGGSMNDTLYGGGDAEVENADSFFRTLFLSKDDGYYIGDKVFLLQTKKVKRGDIIVFNPVDKNGGFIYVSVSGKLLKQQWIKRVIAVGGDTVEIKNKKVFVNGAEIYEPYIKVPDSTYVEGGYLKVDVPQNSVFVMGDNRERGGSNDSRITGCIDTKNIVGKAVLVVGKKSRSIKTVKQAGSLSAADLQAEF